MVVARAPGKLRRSISFPLLKTTACRSLIYLSWDSCSRVAEWYALKSLAQTADEGNVSCPRSGIAALAGVLLVCLGACSHSRIGPGGRVSTADLRANELPVAAEG